MFKEIKEPYGFIYITTNMINGKRYIGQKKFQKGTNLYSWKYYLGSGTNLTRAIKRYGRDNFHKNIVAIAYSKNELDSLEIEWINNYNAVKSDDFYNIATGGSCANTYAGKTEEEMKIIRQEMSILNKGENNPMYGKHLSEETKYKIRETKLGTNNASAKIVICITTGKVFNTLKDGAIKYNISQGNISKCCQGKLKSAGKLEDGTKLVWSYFYVENSEVA